MGETTLSSEIFLIEADASGVTLVAAREPLFPKILTEDAVDQWIEKLQIDLVALSAEMKTRLRTQREKPLFDAG